MNRIAALTLALASFAFAAATTAQPPTASDGESATPSPRELNIGVKPWTGDFDQMIERRAVRVLVPYSRTLYYNDAGHERGLTVQLVRDFENYINKKYAKALGKRPITVFVIPITRPDLLGDVANGLGDIAAANLTETPARLKVVDFVTPKDRKPVKELVLTGPASPTVATIDDLSGNNVHVRRASSYYDSLATLNEQFTTEGKTPITLTVVPPALGDEDMMELLNTGLVELIVVDDWKAKAWAPMLPKVTVTNVAVSEGGYAGWAIRKGSPILAEAINDFYVNWVKKQGVLDYRLARFSKRIQQLTNNTSGADWERFEETVKLFDKYGAKYGFDPIMLAAQGYQESRLRQEARSPVGAIGVMQLMPATGAELNVGDITDLESNIHAGAKYMDKLMTRYFADAEFRENNRTLFAFASYNAGPGRISKLRKEARERGLDPDAWFNNVELVVAEKVGIETTTYVRNIYKYYAAYKLQLEAQEGQREARTLAAPVAK